MTNYLKYPAPGEADDNEQGYKANDDVADWHVGKGHQMQPVNEPEDTDEGGNRREWPKEKGI